jgi:hypothetical protein
MCFLAAAAELILQAEEEEEEAKEEPTKRKLLKTDEEVVTLVINCQELIRAYAEHEGEKYEDMIAPHRALIEQTMKANNIDATEAMKKVQETHAFSSGLFNNKCFFAAFGEILDEQIKRKAKAN